MAKKEVKRIDWAGYYTRLVEKMGTEIVTTAQVYGIVYEINKEIGSNSTPGSVAVNQLMKMLGETLEATEDKSIKVRGRQVPKVFVITNIEEAKRKIAATFKPVEKKPVTVKPVITSAPKKKATLKEVWPIGILPCGKPKPKSELPITDGAKTIKKEASVKKEGEIETLTSDDVNKTTFIIAGMITRNRSSVDINDVSKALREKHGIFKTVKEIREEVSRTKFLRIVRGGDAINIIPGYEWRTIREIYYMSLPLQKYYCRICGATFDEIQKKLKFVPVRVVSPISETDNIYELGLHIGWRRELRCVQDLFRTFRGQDQFFGADELVEQLRNMTVEDTKAALKYDYMYEAERE